MKMRKLLSIALATMLALSFTACKTVQTETDKVVDAAGNAVDGAVDAAGNTVDGAVGAAGNAVDGAVDAAGNVVDGAVDAAGNVVDGAVDAAGNVVDGAVDAAGNAVDGAVDAAGNVVDGAVDAAGNAVDGAGNVLDDAANAVDGAVGGALDSAEHALDSVGSSIGDTANSTKTKVGNALEAIGGEASDLIAAIEMPKEYEKWVPTSGLNNVTVIDTTSGKVVGADSSLSKDELIKFFEDKVGELKGNVTSKNSDSKGHWKLSGKTEDNKDLKIAVVEEAGKVALSMLIK